MEMMLIDCCAALRLLLLDNEVIMNDDDLAPHCHLNNGVISQIIVIKNYPLHCSGTIIYLAPPQLKLFFEVYYRENFILFSAAL